MTSGPFRAPKLSARDIRAVIRENDREAAKFKRTVTDLRMKMRHFQSRPRMEQFDITARLVGDFQGADGYAYLIYADSACHKVHDERCAKIVGQGNYSCHFHLGHIGVTAYNEFMPKHRRWTHGRCFCAQGKTRDQAIGRALKLAGLL